ncbi:unnamed protein product, partial [Phaeothamnion confervicola]
ETSKATSSSAGYRVEGTGWMAGPYAEMRFGAYIFADVKALWGQSSNDISPFLTYTDTFETGRWLASARVKGLWTWSNWRFTPSAQIIGFSDVSDDYVDSLGVSIPGQGVTIGRAIFGPELAYRYVTPDKWFIEPKLAIKGISTFSQDGAAGAVGLDPFRARLEGGLRIEGPDGTRFELQGAYDGISDDNLDAVSGKASVTVPLN